MKKVFIIAFILVFVPCRGEIIKNGKVSVDLDTEKLTSGELQLFEFEHRVKGEGKKKRVLGVILIDATADKVWKILYDWDSMEEFVPGLDHQETKHVIKRANDGTVVESIIECKVSAALFFSIDYTLRVKFDPGKLRQEWTLVTDQEIKKYNKEKKLDIKESSFGIASIEGFEYLEPYDNGKKTIYYYAPVVEVSIPMPAFLERAISKTSLSDFVLAIKARAETVAKNPKP